MPEQDTTWFPGSAAAPQGLSAVPCLYSNNSTEAGPHNPAQPPFDAGFVRLSTQHKKSACALAWNVQAMAERYGIERLGFLTLTFADDVQDRREAQRRFNSLSTHSIRQIYEAYIRVMERQKMGRIHYHLLVVLPGDIRTGFDFAAVDKGDYSSANKLLKDQWRYWRKTAKQFGFGRTELMPVKSTSEGIARYVGKYISKHMAARREDDKGARLVEYSSGGRIASTRFMFNSKGSQLWRAKVCMFAHMVSEAKGTPPTFSGLKMAFGPRWAHEWRDFISSLPDVPMCIASTIKIQRGAG